MTRESSRAFERAGAALHRPRGRSRPCWGRWAVWLGLAGSVLGCAPDRGTIGAVIARTNEQRLVLHEVPPELAAGRAGLLPGDEVLLIDGRDVRELDPVGVHRALAGNLGDPVKLTLLREGRVIRVTLRRSAPPKKI